MTRKVLMASQVYWGAPFHVGSHHFAKVFVELGFEVAFISDPVSPFHIFGGSTESLRSRFSVYFQGGRYDLEGKLWTYVPGAVATPYNKPILSSGWLARNWHRFAVPDPFSVTARKGFENVDLLFLESPKQAFWLDRVKYNRSAFRIADRMSGFGKSSPATEEAESSIAKRVDLVIYAARELESYVAGLGAKKTLHVPNGLDFDHFAKGSRERPADLNGITRPIAIYVGAMDEWFDFELVNEMAEKLGDIAFVLIGPDRLARKRIRRNPNVHLLGPKPFGEIPGYLHNADVGIIPFDVARHGKLVHSVNPLKLYEYMACGLPVVSARWRELETLGSPAVLCTGPTEFIGALHNVIANRTREAGLVKYAEQHDWRNRITQFLESIDLRLP